MDDGSPIRLKVTIDETGGSALCDFTGSGYQVYGNCNAPRAITLSALIYCLRCMVGHDVPLNQGCLNPIKVIIPENSILDPNSDAAVVGGNVLTSQRIVDVVLSAFQVCAASQGCMNNITLGDELFGYYETVKFNNTLYKLLLNMNLTFLLLRLKIKRKTILFSLGKIVIKIPTFIEFCSILVQTSYNTNTHFIFLTLTCMSSRVARNR